VPRQLKTSLLLFLAKIKIDSPKVYYLSFYFHIANFAFLLKTIYKFKTLFKIF